MTDDQRYEKPNQITYDKMRREQKWETEGEEFAGDFSRFVNSSLSKPREAAIKAMLNDHRTLQQGMMRFFLDFASAMALSEHDARNEASVLLAQEITLIAGPLPRI